MDRPLDKLTKLHSRLRCVANGKTDVNAVRARQNGAVRLKPAADRAVEPELAAAAVEPGLKSLGRDIRHARKGARQTTLPDDVEVNVFVLFNRLDAPTPPLVTRRNGRVGVATATLAQLATLNDNPSIQSIE